MGLLFDLLFDSPDSKHPTTNDSYHRDSLEEDYYEDLTCDAFSGDQEAISELKDEFGDDWESEV